MATPSNPSARTLVSSGRRTLTLLGGRARGVARWLTHRGANPAAGVRMHADEQLRDLLAEVAERIGTELGDPRLGQMFEHQMLDTWESTLRPLGNGRTFVITGDIPAMWLRDSSAQLRPFLMLANRAESVRRAIAEVVAQQFDLIAVDPYANAFNATASGLTGYPFDLPSDPRVWERKYEIDSLALPVQLAWQLWRVTGSSEHLTPSVHDGLRTIVEVWRREQHHETASSYRFVRPGTSDTLPRRGHGAPVAECGLTWSGFRPSDDPCEHGYNIPAQLAAVHSLRLAAELAATVFADADLATEATALAEEISAAVAVHGVGAVQGHDCWAFEVDGLGHMLFADDANMPSLLSLPLTAGIDPDDRLYRSTREVILSPANPWFYQGSAASGIGSPHTPRGYVWPIGLAVQALTSDSRDEQLAIAVTLASTDAGTGLMHESFDASDPSRFTRPWFSWANSMFCELLLSLVEGPLDAHVGPRS